MVVRRNGKVCVYIRFLVRCVITADTISACVNCGLNVCCLFWSKFYYHVFYYWRKIVHIRKIFVRIIIKEFNQTHLNIPILTTFNSSHTHTHTHFPTSSNHDLQKLDTHTRQAVWMPTRIHKHHKILTCDIHPINENKPHRIQNTKSFSSIIHFFFKFWWCIKWNMLNL